MLTRQPLTAKRFWVTAKGTERLGPDSWGLGFGSGWVVIPSWVLWTFPGGNHSIVGTHMVTKWLGILWLTILWLTILWFLMVNQPLGNHSIVSHSIYSTFHHAFWHFTPLVNHCMWLQIAKNGFQKYGNSSQMADHWYGLQSMAYCVSKNHAIPEGLNLLTRGDKTDSWECQLLCHDPNTAASRTTHKRQPIGPALAGL